LKAPAPAKKQNSAQTISQSQRIPSELMSVTLLEDLFPDIPFTTLQELYRECGENTNTVVDVLTADQEKSAAESSNSSCTAVSRTERGEQEDENLRRLMAIFPQVNACVINDIFSSLSFNFFDTVDFLIELSNPSCSNSVLSFASKVEDLPSNSSVAHPLSTTLSSSASHGSGRRPFRCPYCGHTCPSGGFRFCPHCGHPLDGRPRL